MCLLIESGFTSEIVSLPGQRAVINLSRVWKILYSLPSRLQSTFETLGQGDRSYVPVGQGGRSYVPMGQGGRSYVPMGHEGTQRFRTRTLRRRYEKDQLACDKLFLTLPHSNNTL